MDTVLNLFVAAVFFGVVAIVYFFKRRRKVRCEDPVSRAKTLGSAFLITFIVKAILGVIAAVVLFVMLAQSM